MELERVSLVAWRLARAAGRGLLLLLALPLLIYMLAPLSKLLFDPRDAHLPEQPSVWASKNLDALGGPGWAQLTWSSGPASLVYTSRSRQTSGVGELPAPLHGLAGALARCGLEEQIPIRAMLEEQLGNSGIVNLTLLNAAELGEAASCVQETLIAARPWKPWGVADGDHRLLAFSASLSALRAAAPVRGASVTRERQWPLAVTDSAGRVSFERQETRPISLYQAGEIAHKLTCPSPNPATLLTVGVRIDGGAVITELSTDPPTPCVEERVRATPGALTRPLFTDPRPKNARIQLPIPLQEAR
jgi:hypothetical protein